MLIKSIFNKKSVSPIIATLLLITVSIVIGVSMFNWYSEYADNINQDVNNKGFSKQIKVDYIGQDKLYAFNEYSNAQIESFTLDGIQCNITTQNKNFSKGLVELNFDPSCAKNLDSDMNKIILITDKGTFSRLISTSDIDPSLSPTSNNEENNINYCPSGSFTYNDITFNYNSLQESSTNQLTETNTISNGVKTSKIDITCNYPNVNYNTNSFTSSITCNSGYSLTSSNTCELTTKYCPSGSFTYDNVLFEYTNIQEDLSRQLTKTEEVFAGSKTSKIDITCNYPNVEYDTNTFTSSTICDPNYSLTSSNTCELITSCNSGDYSYNNELFSYPFLDSGSTYISTKTETNNNEGSILSKNLGLLCENTIISNTSYEEVLSCLDGYELDGNTCKLIRYEVLENTLIDHELGLEWQRTNLPTSTMNWNSAVSYCNNLNHAGYSDWRLPTLREMELSIVDRFDGSPYIIGNYEYFPEIKSYYWTNTIYSSSSAYYVYFNNGISSSSDISDSNYVLCARNSN